MLPSLASLFFAYVYLVFNLNWFILVAKPKQYKIVTLVMCCELYSTQSLHNDFYLFYHFVSESGSWSVQPWITWNVLCRLGCTGTQQKSFCLPLPNAEVQGHHSAISSPCLPPEVFAKLIFIQSISKGESRLLATGRDPEPESLFHLIYVVYLL